MKKKDRRKKNIRDKKIRFRMEEVIAAALLKFGKLDVIDLNMIVEKLNNSDKFDVHPYLYIDKLKGIVKIHSDGTITLKENQSFDNVIADGKTIRDIYTNRAGKELLKYFRTIDKRDFIKEKEKLLEEKGKLIQQNSKILLVSDNEKDYDELINNGFKNIDYFKSRILAEKYFEEHPGELKKYDISIQGNNIVRDINHFINFDFEKKIKEMNENIIILRPYRYERYYTNDKDNITCYDFYDGKTRREWSIKNKSMNEFCKNLIDCAIANGVYKNINKDSVFNKIEIESVQEQELPTKKEDLKILLLAHSKIDNNLKEYLNDLGLNIIYEEDNNFALERHVIRNLGEYDIIIASKLFSSNLLRMQIEQNEQYKLSGKKLGLLAIYDNCGISVYDADYNSNTYGDMVKIRYTFTGKLSESLEEKSLKYKVLRDGEEYNYHKINKKITKSYLEQIVSIYDKELKELGHNGLLNIKYKDSNEYTEEYEEYEKVIKEKEEEYMKPIRDFDSFRYHIMSYLDYRKRGLIKKQPNDIKVYDNEKEIIVQNLFNDRILCTLAFPKRQSTKNLRIFTVQTMTKKGNLSEPKIVGLYSNKYENIEDIPKRPNDTEMNAITSIEKKVNYTVVPINKNAYQTSKRNKNKVYKK